MLRHTLMIAALFSLILAGGCERSSPTMNVAASAPQSIANDNAMTDANHGEPKRHLIDYGHMRDGVLYHGTISDLDGHSQATWTFELNGEKTTQTRQLSETEFDSIWNAIADGNVFKKSVVTDPESTVDPIANHIVSVFMPTVNRRSYAITRFPVMKMIASFFNGSNS